MKDSVEADSVGQAVVNELAREVINEQRRSRRWGIFFKLLFAFYFLIFFAGFFLFYAGENTDSFSIRNNNKHTALVKVHGIIAPDSEANAAYIVAGLRDAFEDKNTAGVVLQINSPGGSPVQAAYVYDEIKRLRALHEDIPIYAVISDVCASGGYYIAAAADKIYANESSIVGSIGVIMAGFGFVDAISNLGVERRLFYAGKNKAFMDPFSPLKEAEKDHLQKILAEVHQQFKDVVIKGRGERLTEDKKLFSGLVWTGAKSVDLGLIDAIGSAGYVAREVIGAEDVVDFTYHKDYLTELTKSLGSTIANAFTTYFTHFQLR